MDKKDGMSKTVTVVMVQSLLQNMQINLQCWQEPAIRINCWIWLAKLK